MSAFATSPRRSPDALAALSATLLLEDLLTPPTDDPAWDDLMRVTGAAGPARTEQEALIAFFVDAAVELGLDTVQVPDAEDMIELLGAVSQADSCARA